ncbi:VanZ family protein [Streptococcus cuniculipharyngis]|uniref:VanZ family protein n=1 Tax=Streptococcus cuniculipharyngis TaxID=1562651 RepID=A0A5C5SG25_9STRE|nr:VanZ family protein [Streptococcus cuniculipharyngis]TWS99220.1 VanZ family protein [Streptococcus cuniculipharyngis]
MKKRSWLLLGMLVYGGLICLMCFSPQQEVVHTKTPGIQYMGPVPFLLIPFNTLVNYSQIRNWWDLAWLIGQNLMNIFLLYPLVFLLLLWDSRWRSYRSVLGLGFGLSLLIELGQVVLDILFQINRVFEIDDLLTNTLGALLAYLTYQYLAQKRIEQ